MRLPIRERGSPIPVMQYRHVPNGLRPEPDLSHKCSFCGHLYLTEDRARGEPIHFYRDECPVMRRKLKSVVVAGAADYLTAVLVSVTDHEPKIYEYFERPARARCATTSCARSQWTT